MRKLFLYILFCTCLVLMVAPVDAFSISKEIKEGNRLYDEGKYEEAIEKYNEAKAESPDMDIVNFNLGDALYKSGQYQESVDAFTRALNTEDPEIEADAIYNIANTKYKLGSTLLNTDLNSAADHYREALDYYKRAIEINEHNSSAKFNHELVERELKVLLDKIKNQPEQQQDKDGEEKKEEKQQSDEKSDENKKEEQQEAENEQKQTGDHSPEKQQEEESAGQPEEKEGEMTPEEARMLLDAFGEEEALENLKKQKSGYYPDVVKDW